MPVVKDNELKINEVQNYENDEELDEIGTAFEVAAPAEYIEPESIKLDNEQPVNKIIKSGPEFELEEDHLAGTAEAVRKQIKKVARSVGYTDRYAVVKGGDDGTEEIQLRYEKEASREYVERLNHLHDLSEKPYEFRVDIIENGRLKTYYLGTDTISGHGAYSVYSYHDNKYNQYLNGASRGILSAVELRRRFGISGGQLKNYKNTYIRSDAAAEGITNPYLLQILQERRKDHTVRNIVASIQEGQNKIVQAPSSASMIIQGCAGSGKTVIMMQRLSRLQNYLKYVNAYDVVIITPSSHYQLFMKALTEGLAIQRMQQSTIEQYYEWVLSQYNRDFALQVDKVRRDSDGNQLYAAYIYSDQFREDLCSGLPEELKRTREVFVQLVLICRKFDIPVLISPEKSADGKLWENLQVLLKTVRERIDDRQEDDYPDAMMKGRAEWKRALEAETARLQSEIDDLSPLSIYKRLFQKAAESALEKLSIRRTNRHYKYDLYARLLFCREYYGTNLDLHSFICIDEGQDLSLNEYRLLKELCGKSSIFNVYGDIYQNINTALGIHDWKDLSKAVKARQYVLEENYRNTSQIIRRCREEFNIHIRTMGLEGPEIRTASLEQIAKVELKRKAGKKERWAVIIPRNMSKRKLFAELEKEVPNGILSLNRISEDNVVLVNVEDIKGFEFEKIYCLYEGMADNERYVAYTRALQELVLVKVPDPEKYKKSDGKGGPNRKSGSVEQSETAAIEELKKSLKIDLPKEKIIPLLYQCHLDRPFTGL